MAESRIISEITVGNGNVFFQGNVTGNVSVNHHAEDLQKQEKRDVLKRLYTSPYEDRKDRNPKRVPGTCDWFVSHEHFRTWNESNSSSMLWVSADPGCGKSVLVRHLVDTVIQTTESRTVCYFFFKDDFADQKNIISALSCILRQIFIQNPSLLSDEILKRFNSGGEIFATSFSELWNTLLQVAESKNAAKIVCLLDAIDEYEDHGGQGRSKLLEALCTLYGTRTRKLSNLKFLLTSRPYVGIYRSLQPIQLPGLPVIHLSGESEDEVKKISLEINIYIDARVKDIGERLHLSQAECDLLLKKLLHVPNRTYLWVYLVLNFIENSINVNKMMIIDATSNIPTTVDEAYERILSKSFNTEQARKALHIIVAAARPLTLKEMNFALALDKGGRQSYDELGLEPDDRFHETLRNICGLCVVVVDSRVYLLHQTVKEFLVQTDGMHIHGGDCADLKWKFSLSLLESHRILAEICIWHLLAGLTIKSAIQRNWRESFLDYSAKHWASHFHQMSIETQSIMTESILMICDVTSSCCHTWFSSYWTTMNTDFPWGFDTLMMVSYFGLNLAVSSLLATPNIKLDTRDGMYQRSALCWAIRNGFHLVAKILLNGIYYRLGTMKLPVKRRAKVNLQDKYGRAALTYAVWNGDVNLVQFLIKAGARADLRDELEGTPLSYAFCGGNAQIIDLFAKEKREVDIENDINGLLLSAAEKGHEEVMSLLLKTNRANIEARDPIGRTPLIVAAKEHHWTMVELLIKGGADVNALNEFNETPLAIAANVRQWTIVELLLKAGADASIYNRDGQPPLIIAAKNHKWIIMQLLLEAGADANVDDRDGQTPLIIAANNHQWIIMQLLLKAGADANAYSRDGQAPLIIAADYHQWEIVSLLIHAGAALNAHNEFGQLALLRALFEGHNAIVKLLLEAGADANAHDKDGRTLLTIAAEKEYVIIVELLLEAGADANTRNKEGHTALIKASDKGHEAIVRLLLNTGADINASDAYGNTALIMASWYGYKAVVELLLNAGADINASDVYGDTALIAASWGGHNAVMELLFSAGADINAFDDSGQTALIKASQYGRDAVVELLLEAGAKINASNNSGKTALIRASQYGCDTIVRLLLEAGAKINASNNSGETALIRASQYGHDAVVRLLLDAGADINTSINGETALIIASWGGYKAVVELLLKAGADINASNNSGETALTAASKNGYEATVKLLLKAGADINASDIYGSTALIMASWGGHEAIRKLLLEAGANRL